MNLILGIIIGLLISIILIIFALWSKPKLERVIQRTQANIAPKGKILEPDNEEFTDFINNLKQE